MTPAVARTENGTNENETNAPSVDSASTLQPAGVRVLVYSYDYFPEIPFRIKEQLQQSTVVRVLRRSDGRRVPEIVQPSEYNGYIIEYRMQEDPQVSGITGFIYTRELLDTTARYRLTTEAEVFSIQLNLLESVAVRID